MLASHLSKRYHHPTEPVWLTAAYAPYGLDKELRPWLLDRGSLTQRLVAASHHCFSVGIHYQGTAFPRPAEASALKLPLRRTAMIREVILFGHGQPWVFARSIVPLTTLTGRLRTLRHLDNRPLGALLFKDPSMRRGPIDLAKIMPKHHIIPSEIKQELPAWGRRSIFFLDEKPLLVSEIFLETFNPSPLNPPPLPTK